MLRWIYRKPHRGGNRIAWLANELAKDEALGAAAASGKLALGLAMCLIGPAFVTMIAMDIEYRWDWQAAPGFAKTLLIFAILLIPILMWLERRTRGEFLAALDANDAARPIAELITPEHPQAPVARAVRYLMGKQWVDISARRDRVWLSSRVRQRLAEASKGARSSTPD